MKHELRLSNMGHTWILDLDGTLVKHNGYKMEGKDTLLEGARSFLDQIPKEDLIVIISSRENKYRRITEDFLKLEGIRYDYILFNAPYGERIIVNDKKESGLKTTAEILLVRDTADFPEVVIDPDL